MLNLNQWSQELTGLPGNDDWTCYRFDAAVCSFGEYVQGKMRDTDDKRSPEMKLKALLSDEKPKSTFDRMLSFFGMAPIGKGE